MTYIALLYIRFCLPGLISGCNVKVSLSCAPAYREKGNHKGICLHYITRRGAPSELINFPDCITCILKAHRNLECNDFVPNGTEIIRFYYNMLPNLCFLACVRAPQGWHGFRRAREVLRVGAKCVRGDSNWFAHLS